MFKIKEDQVSFEQRRMAKVVNFSIMYGAGPFRLSQELDIPMKDAKEIIDMELNVRKYYEDNFERSFLFDKVEKIFFSMR